MSEDSDQSDQLPRELAQSAMWRNESLEGNSPVETPPRARHRDATVPTVLISSMAPVVTPPSPVVTPPSPPLSVPTYTNLDDSDIFNHEFLLAEISVLDE